MYALQFYQTLGISFKIDLRTASADETMYISPRNQALAHCTYLGVHCMHVFDRTANTHCQT